MRAILLRWSDGLKARNSFRKQPSNYEVISTLTDKRSSLMTLPNGCSRPGHTLLQLNGK